MVLEILFFMIPQYQTWDWQSLNLTVKNSLPTKGIHGTNHPHHSISYTYTHDHRNVKKWNLRTSVTSSSNRNQPIFVGKKPSRISDIVEIVAIICGLYLLYVACLVTTTSREILFDSQMYLEFPRSQDLARWLEALSSTGFIAIWISWK